jgi:hypothetical protein
MALSAVAMALSHGATAVVRSDRISGEAADDDADRSAMRHSIAGQPVGAAPSSAPAKLSLTILAFGD